MYKHRYMFRLSIIAIFKVYEYWETYKALLYRLYIVLYGRKILELETQGYKSTDINLDGIFHKNFRGHHFWPKREWIHFVRASVV